MRINTIKLLLILCFFSLFLSKECKEFLSGVFEKQSLASDELTAEEEAFLSFSDSNMFGVHLGKKDECESVPSMKYFVAVTQFVTNEGYHVRNGHGVCLPQTCESSDVAQNQALLKEIFDFRG